MPEDGTCPTNSGALNAFSISHDGKTAFILNREKGLIFQQNLETGNSTELLWKNKNFGIDKFVIYCLFHWKRLEDGNGPDRIGLLLFDRKNQKFRIPLFIVTGGNQLRTIRDFDIPVSKIKQEKLAYSAHKHAGKIELIFYERYNRQIQNETLNFVYYAIDLSTLEVVRTKTGTLPNGKWELPFVAEMRIHFISLDRTGGKIASLPMNFLLEQEWTVQEIQQTNNGEIPSKHAIWCHAWEHGCPWFVVAKPMTTPSQMMFVQLWTINLTTKQWHRVTPGIQLRSDYTNLAIRATNSNSIFMYCDSSETENAFFVSFDVTDYVNSRRKQAEKEEQLDKPITSKNYADIICPICLETYSDPRTLFCGHSLCFNCLNRMRETGSSSLTDVKCPNCRKVTKIPSDGLPTNYGLQQAIEMMIKAQKIHESGFFCNNCKEPGLLDDFWLCLTCLKQMPINLPESAEMTCSKCILKFHENHSTKIFSDFQKYCTNLQVLKDESNQKIQKIADQIGDELKQLIQQQIVERLITSTKDIVQSFTEMKMIHDEKSLENQKNEIDETLKVIASRLKVDAKELFPKMLEKAILDDENPSTCTPLLSRQKPVKTVRFPRLSTTKEFSDEELLKELMKIP